MSTRGNEDEAEKRNAHREEQRMYDLMRVVYEIPDDEFGFVDMNVPCTKECWKVKGEDDPVLEVWESYNGDLYFITEKDDVSGCVFMYARLYAMPQFAEWGSNNINYLREQYGCDKLWLVPKKNWPNIETYEKGLLVQCQSASPKVAALSFFAPQSQRGEALSPRVSVFFPFLHAGAGAPSCAGICLI